MYIFHPKIDAQDYDEIGIEVYSALTKVAIGTMNSKRFFCSDGDLTLRHGIVKHLPAAKAKDCMVHLHRATDRWSNHQHQQNIWHPVNGLLAATSRVDFDDRCDAMSKEDADFKRVIGVRDLKERLWAISHAVLEKERFARDSTGRFATVSTNSGEAIGKHAQSVSGVPFGRFKGSYQNRELVVLMRSLAGDLRDFIGKFRRALNGQDRDLTLLPWAALLAKSMKLESLMDGVVETYEKKAFDAYLKSTAPPIVVLSSNPAPPTSILDLGLAEAPIDPWVTVIASHGREHAAAMVKKADRLLRENAALSIANTSGDLISMAVRSDTDFAFHVCTVGEGICRCDNPRCEEVRLSERHSVLCAHVVAVVKASGKSPDFLDCLLQKNPLTLTQSARISLKAGPRGPSNGKKKGHRKPTKRKRSSGYASSLRFQPASKKARLAPSAQEDNEPSLGEQRGELEREESLEEDAEPSLNGESEWEEGLEEDSESSLNGVSAQEEGEDVENGPSEEEKAEGEEGEHGAEESDFELATATLRNYERNHASTWNNAASADPSGGEVFVETPSARGRPYKFTCSSNGCGDEEKILGWTTGLQSLAFFIVRRDEKGKLKKKVYCSLNCLREANNDTTVTSLTPAYFVTGPGDAAAQARADLIRVAREENVKLLF